MFFSTILVGFNSRIHLLGNFILPVQRSKNINTEYPKQPKVFLFVSNIRNVDSQDRAPVEFCSLFSCSHVLFQTFDHPQLRTSFLILSGTCLYPPVN